MITINTPRGPREVGPGQPVFVIAEIGKNFIQTQEEKSVAEYLENAKALVKAAADSGAEAVKFQTHQVTDEQLNITVVSPHFKGADRYSWVTRNTKSTPLEEFWKPLKAYCDEIGILFHTTPMSRGAAERVAELKPELWKVGSGDILDFVCLDYLAATGKPVFVSSGMSTLEELDKTVDFLKRHNAPTLVFHCVSKYPCPPEDLRLGTIAFLSERYHIPIGFSDHSIGIDSALAGVALGANAVEKHFSFDRALWGADHKVSMTPAEMRAMVDGIRALEADASLKESYLEKEIVQRGMGGADKVLQEDEAVFRPYFRKSLMAGRDLPAGTVITKDMLYAMRPQQYAGGLPSEQYEHVLGKTLTQDLKQYDPITDMVLE